MSEVEQPKPKPKPATPGVKPEAPKDPVNSGSVKIGFGEKLVVELKAEFKETEMKFSGSAKDIDVSDMIDGFFQKASVEPPTPPTVAKKKDNNIIAKDISIELVIPRKKKPAAAAPAETVSSDEFKESGALTVTVKLARGESELTLLLVAAAMSKGTGPTEWKVLFAGDLNLKAKGLPLVGDILGDKADSFGVELHALYLKTLGAGLEQTADEVVAKKLFGRSKELKAWRVNGNAKNDPIKLKEGFDVKAEILTWPPGDPTGDDKAELTGPAGTGTTAATPAPKPSSPPAGQGLTW